MHEVDESIGETIWVATTNPRGETIMTILETDQSGRAYRLPERFGVAAGVLVATMLALFMVASATSAHAANDTGKKVAEGAFHSLGTGGGVIAFGAASPANPAAKEVWDRVRIFGYGGGPSEGRTYCGDVWNVIVTVNISPPFVDRAGVHEVFATQTLDGVVVGATDETAVRWSSTFGTLVQAHGTFLPPGTLTDGTHEVSQTVEHDVFGVALDRFK